MSIRYFLPFLLLCQSAFLFGQNPTPHYYGGPGNAEQIVASTVDPAGGVQLLTHAHTGEQAHELHWYRLDATGEQAAEHLITLPDSILSGIKLAAGPVSSLLLLNSSRELSAFVPVGEQQPLLLALDTAGNTLRTTTLDVDVQRLRYAAIIPLTSGGFALAAYAGIAGTRLRFYCFDERGNLRWQRERPGLAEGGIQHTQISLLPTPDGGFTSITYLLGRRTAYSYYPDGTPRWAQILPAEYYARQYTALPDGHILSVGVERDPSTARRVLRVRTIDTLGNQTPARRTTWSLPYTIRLMHLRPDSSGGGFQIFGTHDDRSFYQLQFDMPLTLIDSSAVWADSFYLPDNTVLTGPAGAYFQIGSTLTEEHRSVPVITAFQTDGTRRYRTVLMRAGPGDEAEGLLVRPLPGGERLLVGRRGGQRLWWGRYDRAGRLLNEYTYPTAGTRYHPLDAYPHADGRLTVFCSRRGTAGHSYYLLRFGATGELQQTTEVPYQQFVHRWQQPHLFPLADGCLLLAGDYRTVYRIGADLSLQSYWEHNSTGTPFSTIAGLGARSDGSLVVLLRNPSTPSSYSYLNVDTDGSPTAPLPIEFPTAGDDQYQPHGFFLHPDGFGVFGNFNVADDEGAREAGIFAAYFNDVGGRTAYHFASGVGINGLWYDATQQMMLFLDYRYQKIYRLDGPEIVSELLALPIHHRINDVVFAPTDGALLTAGSHQLHYRKNAFWTQLLLESIADPTAGVSLDIYPNPTRGPVKVILRSSSYEGPITYHLYDAMGKERGRNSLHVGRGRTQLDWDLDDLPAGTYFLVVRFGEEQSTARLLIQ